MRGVKEGVEEAFTVGNRRLWTLPIVNCREKRVGGGSRAS